MAKNDWDEHIRNVIDCKLCKINQISSFSTYLLSTLLLLLIAHTKFSDF